MLANLPSWLGGRYPIRLASMKNARGFNVRRRKTIFGDGRGGARHRERTAVARASSPPISVGAQTLLHYLSSSADNSYSPRYVRSALSLTPAPNAPQHGSLSRRDWSGHLLRGIISHAVFCPSLSLKVCSVTLAFFFFFPLYPILPYVTAWHTKKSTSHSGLPVESP